MANFSPGVAGSSLARRGKEACEVDETPGGFELTHQKNRVSKQRPEQGISPFSGLQKIETPNANFEIPLQLLEELASRARNINPARSSAFAVLHALHNTSGLTALRAIRALAGVHDLFPVRRLCNLSAYCHGSFLLISITQRPARFVARMMWMGC